MLTIGIVPNKEKEESRYYLEQLLVAMEAQGVKALVAGDAVSDALRGDDTLTAEAVCAHSDLVICMGGDGTFLQVAAKAVLHQVPLFGLHLGTLGLLTEFDKQDIPGTVRRLVRGDYSIEERKLMQVCVTDREGREQFRDYAVNDCVLARDNLSKLAYIHLRINDFLVETYPCDAMIVATQTGSTAYSLSAGGPIVEPGNDIMIVTPVSPHFTDGRSIIAKGSSRICLDMYKKHLDMQVCVDGRRSYCLGDEERIELTLSDRALQIVRMDPPNFFGALKRKIREREERLRDEI